MEAAVERVNFFKKKESKTKGRRGTVVGGRGETNNSEGKL